MFDAIWLILLDNDHDEKKNEKSILFFVLRFSTSSS